MLYSIHRVNVYILKLDHSSKSFVIDQNVISYNDVIQNEQYRHNNSRSPPKSIIPFHLLIKIKYITNQSHFIA